MGSAHLMICSLQTSLLRSAVHHRLTAVTRLLIAHVTFLRGFHRSNNSLGETNAFHSINTPVCTIYMYLMVCSAENTMLWQTSRRCPLWVTIGVSLKCVPRPWARNRGAKHIICHSNGALCPWARGTLPVGEGHFARG